MDPGRLRRAADLAEPEPDCERDRIKAEHDFDVNVLALRTLAELLADVHDPNAQHGCVTGSTTYSASTRTASLRHRPTGHRTARRSTSGTVEDL